MDWTQVAADGFGNAIGNAIVDQAKWNSTEERIRAENAQTQREVARMFEPLPPETAVEQPDGSLLWPSGVTTRGAPAPEPIVGEPLPESDWRVAQREYDRIVRLAAEDQPLETPLLAPDDLIGTGIFKGAAVLASKGLAKTGLELGALALGTRAGGRTTAEALELFGTKALIGDSRVLAENLIEHAALPGRPIGYDAHHLIPSSAAEEYLDLFKSAAQHGFDINSAKNGLFLPRTVNLAEETALPLHRGGHLEAYFNYVDRQLVTLQEKFSVGEVTARQLPERLNQIAETTRQALIERMVFLTRKDPAYPVGR